MLDLEQALLDFVNRPNYQPVKARVIAKKLGLNDDDAAELRRIAKRLAKQGKLAWGGQHRIAPAIAATAAPKSIANNTQSPVAASHSGGVVGLFRRNQAGFGFVRLSTPAADGSPQPDIYVAANDAGDASTGDLVVVRIKSARDHRREGPAGAIVEIIERETHQFVGTYFESGGAALVEVDGTLFSRPIAVGDPGAKGARPDDKVVFEMVRFPSHAHDGEGVLIEVLGARGQPGVDTLSIIREYGLPEEFASDAQDEARVEAERFDESILSGRLDLTGETVITIDPVDARDFDDAISLERLDGGHWRLGVHIADVSHFVRPKSALDREAHQRATSVYLPDRVIPMLPEIISNGLASLQPGRVRYTKTAFIEYTAEGAPVAVDLHSAAIKSDRRFTYEEVDEFLADRASWRSRLEPKVFGLLGRMHELAMLLRRRRFVRGSLELSLSEVKVDLDKEGRVVGAHRVQNTESHQIIEEFMLAANEAVAETLAKAEYPFLRRIHPAPDPRKLKALTEFVAELGFKTQSLESRFEVQKLLKHVAGRPEEHAVNYAVLRSLQRAVYAPAEEGHFALASDCYTHFTSPIRRYPDLTIHRLIDALLAKKRPKASISDLTVLGEHCSSRERRAESAERDLTKVKLLTYLSTRIGDELAAVITGVEQFGLFVQGTELPAEGLIHISALSDDFYRFDRASHTLTGHRTKNAHRLGDLVRVVVARVDIDRRELDFRLVGKLEAAKPAKLQHARKSATKAGVPPLGGASKAAHGKRGRPTKTELNAKPELTTRRKSKGGKTKPKPKPGKRGRKK